MRYVLIIPGWFPSRVNFLAGDFIERHAKAGSLFFPVKVLYVVKDDTLPFGKIELEHQQVSGNYEAFIYYYSSRSSIGLIEKTASVLLQSECLARGYRKITRQYGQPSLLHAHVLVKHAWFALKQSRRYHIPLLASEQWTGYLPEAKGEFESLTFFQRKTIQKIFRHAVHVTTVSAYLADKIKERFFYSDYTVIPNLVDTSVFRPAVKQRGGITKFIHISTLSSQKNFDEILQACTELKKTSSDFLLSVIAPSNKYEQEVNELGLSENIVFKKEIPQVTLSKLVADSDALILYSNYETFGCVIVEANACGVPVIASDYPVFNENVMDHITGFKAPLHQPEALADRMLKIINKQHSFDKQQIISLTKEKYSFEVVGKQFAEVYKRYAKP